MTGARIARSRAGGPRAGGPRAGGPRTLGPQRPDRHDYQTLAEFRHLLQRFLAFSQVAAREAGLAPRQHQALLAIKGFPREGGVTIHDLAERLCIQHHSAVELVDRLADSGLVERRHDPADRRRVLLDLTRAAEHRLADLSAIHLDELQRLRPALAEILHAIGP
jgi:DNA-binding MarR family transcriptional regulator